MLDSSDAPKIWVDPTEVVEEPASSQELVVTDMDETALVPALSVEEQKELIEKEAPESYKSMMNALVEVSQMANMLEKIDTDQSQMIRRRVLDLTTEEFIRKRMQTNVKLEDMKVEMLQSVWENMDSLDLTTRFEMAARIHEMTQVDGQKPLGSYTNPTANMHDSNGPGINLTINNATGADSQITTNSLAVGGPAPIQDLKTLSNINSTVKTWGDIPKKVNPIDVNSEDYNDTTDTR